MLSYHDIVICYFEKIKYYKMRKNEEKSNKNRLIKIHEFSHLEGHESLHQDI